MYKIRVILILSLSILFTCGHQKESNNIPTYLQKCIDTISHISDVNRLGKIQVYLEKNQYLKNDPGLNWNGKKILYTEVKSKMKEVWTPGANQERKSVILQLEKVSFNNNLQKVEVYLVNIKESFQVTFVRKGNKVVVTKVVVTNF